MFTIIAGVLGVGIAIALLIVAANYFGSVFGDSAEKSKYAAYQNTGNQIRGAVQFYATERGTFPQGTGEDIIQILEGNNVVVGGVGQNPEQRQYVKTIPRDLVSPPAPGTRENWQIVGKFAFTPLRDIEQCKKMNNFANMVVTGSGAPSAGTPEEGCPVCSDTAFDSYPACRNQP